MDGDPKTVADPRVRQDQNGPEPVLVPSEASAPGREITIRLAKAAIAAGWQVLSQEARIQEQEASEVIVAGAFGTYIDLDRAVSIGMLPPIRSLHFEQVGNVPGTGVRTALVSRAERERAAHIACHAEYVELTTRPHFQEQFTRGMSL